MLTPKAFANSSPGFERAREPWDQNNKSERLTLKGLGVCGNNPYRVYYKIRGVYPGLSQARTLG